MEPPLACPPLIQARTQRKRSWERPLAAPMLFAALAWAGGCGRLGAPQVQARLRIGLGAAALAMAPDGHTLAVACRRSNDVWLLDMNSGPEQAPNRIDTGARPRALLFQAGRPGFFVAEGISPNASVALLRLDDHRVARRYQPKGLLGRWLELPQEQRLLAARVGEPLLGVYRSKDWHLVKAVNVGGEVTALYAGQGSWWAATRQADSFVRLSPRDMSLQAVALAGPEPHGLDVDLKGGLAYVACQGRRGEAAPLSLPTPTPLPAVLSPLDVSDTTEADAQAAEDEETDAADAEDTEDVIQRLQDQDAGRFAGGGIAVFRLEDTRRVDYIPLPGGPSFVAASLDGRRLAIACADGQLRMLDLASRKVTHLLQLGGVPGAMQASTDGKELWVALSNVKHLLRVKPGAGW